MIFFIQVQAGAGGTESMDWAAMILNMYKMWADRRGFSVSTVDEMPGEIAGIKVICCLSFFHDFFLLFVPFELQFSFILTGFME